MPERVGQQLVQQVRHLRRAVDQQPSVVVDRGRRGVRLHRRDGDALVDVTAANDHVGVAEQVGVDRIGGAERDVVAVRLEQDRRVVGQRLFRRHRGRQRLVVDDHHVGGVLGLRDGVGEHGDDRLADEPNSIGRQRWPGEVVVDGDHALERGEAEVGGGPHGDDAGCIFGCDPCRSPVMTRVGHLGADEHQLQLVAQIEVADVFGGAEQQLGVFRAQDSGAENRTSHSRTLPGHTYSYRLMEITASDVVLGSNRRQRRRRRRRCPPTAPG